MIHCPYQKKPPRAEPSVLDEGEAREYETRCGEEFEPDCAHWLATGELKSP